MMAHSYASLFGLPATGLRFFTVYGPWGRPDMAVYKFTHAIARRPRDPGRQCGRCLARLHLCGRHRGRHRAAGRPGAQPDPAWNAESPDPATSAAPHRVYNIGNDSPEEVNHLIALIEDALGREGQPRGRAAAARRRAGDPRRRERTCAATWASRPRPRWRRASDASSNGIASITGRELMIGDYLKLLAIWAALRAGGRSAGGDPDRSSRSRCSFAMRWHARTRGRATRSRLRKAEGSRLSAPRSMAMALASRF